jgi:type II secretory pathway pseudopilin PulG
MLRILRNTRGTTLVEVLVATLLIVVVTVAFLVLLTQSSTFSKHIDQVYAASHLAQRRIEILKRFEFDQLYPYAEESDIRINVDGTVDPNGDYIRTTGVYTQTNPYLLRVKVSVDRVVDGSPAGHPVIMETMLSDTK